MDLSFIIMALGVLLIGISFFVKDTSKKVEAEVEDLSFTVYQETSALKRRIKVIEEELLIEPIQPAPKKKHIGVKPIIHEIIRSQVLELHKQGYSLKEISTRSSLSVEEVKSVIGGSQG
ncbi:MAG: hypothetical protein ABS938_15615 [Psychrobacillus psychrodurans]